MPHGIEINLQESIDYKKKVSIFVTHQTYNMKLKDKTKLDIIELNLDSLKIGQEESLITVDTETFEMGLNSLVEDERYEDCSLMRDHKNKFVTDEKIVRLVVV
ncbi:MAG: hypothetical protein SLAVMIC_00658 [uncultured marine phage]|uniref:Uncharacterized protein n=1 Tax=uncultured marine phage TaxID=707152 RepID=A0A8D9FRA2_9VIRU|nr:MAG: hypothetical protein SLAVMIC_00658 [uncultured marine phage]